jgi:Cu+-exporting ATPase
MMEATGTPAGPSGGKVSCSGCGAPLDPLRAGHVAIFASQFHFFCNRNICRQQFVGETPIASEVVVEVNDSALDRETSQRKRAELEARFPPVRAAAASIPDESVPERISVDETRDIIEPVAARSAVMDEVDIDPPERREVGLLLVALSLIAGVLTMALELADDTRLVSVARVVLLVVGSSALLGKALTARPDASRPHWLVVIVAPLLASVVATWALLAGGDVVARAAFLGGTVLTVAAVNLWLVGLAARPVRAGRRWVERRLDVPARRVVGEPTQLSQKEVAYDLQPGEHVLVESGEAVPVDLVIVEGEVEVVPPVGSVTRLRRKPGDTVVAGSRVTQGQLRGEATHTGDDRSIARPVLAGPRRSDVHSELPRLSRSIAERWAPVAAVFAGAVFALFGWSAIETGMVVVSVYAAFGNVAVGSLSALSIARGVRHALGRGVIYNDAAAWDGCARVTAAVFCARGTLLRGEPELVEIEGFERGARSISADAVLSIAAGALSSEANPVAIAVRRAARARKLAASPVRNARSIEGRGVTAVAATGESLVVGGRTLLLEKSVSVAAAESRIYELEAAGRTMVLVARAGRLIGLLALQDGLRSGARAAVQHVLDAKMEPILMSSDTRETCEALGRALDIDHLRPEVLADERGAAVQRIKDTGATVAVLGHAPFDDDALRQADTAVALAAAGSDRDDLSVVLVSDDVRDAALALSIAHRTRLHASTALVLVVGPAAFGAVAVTMGMLPPEYAPLAQLLGAIAAAWHLR